MFALVSNLVATIGATFPLAPLAVSTALISRALTAETRSMFAMEGVV